MADNQNTARRARRQRPHLTDAIVRRLDPTPPRIVYDGPGPGHLAGFGIRLSPTSRSWVLNYSLNRRERRLTIGGWPTWNAKQARDRAQELKREIDRGLDPIAVKAAADTAPTMTTLLDEYERVARSKRSWSDDASMIRAYIRPRLGAMKVRDVTPDHIEMLHAAISKHAPTRANRCVSCLSSIFSLAIKRRWITASPSKGCTRNTENRRERFLSPAELGALLRVLADWPDQQQAAAVRLALLSGARRGEILSMEWSHVDLAEMTWRKPMTKNGRPQTLPISREFADVLAGLPHRSRFVFPNVRGNKPLTEVADWPALRRSAGLADFRFHDLRHTSASLLLAGGASLALIAGVLNHTSITMSARYAHLGDTALRAAVDGLGKAVGGK